MRDQRNAFELTLCYLLSETKPSSGLFEPREHVASPLRSYCSLHTLPWFRRVGLADAVPAQLPIIKPQPLHFLFVHVWWP